MNVTWTPFREPFRTTLTRTILIAVVLGAVIARWWGGWHRWPLAVVVALWPSLGGHCVELWFLNWLRPRISPERRVQILARLAVWFIAGIVFAIGMAVTATALSGIRVRWPAWWMGGLGFIVVELIAHTGLQLRKQPSFYNGRG